ncbi:MULTISPECIES: fumarate reductase cytochrome b subunit [Shewanella]|jgi:fumarate reductase subunit C|uniref:Fumarate reductase respiratory complex, transmembrane subunit n=3 Tax=Shewanella putrefaciens TaxID=24 RepID=E6XQP8_SHEP2|nr:MULTISPECIES: fumarate reductase cytochrome b subunit [Shewanella]CAD6364416.1 Fumarate reductase cytochrome b subunit [Shewanella hafniensis]ABM23350.1 fumarate reductase respiratory complex, transmembrane subunit [Shewanella sp. W3-18-1]AVV85069.1 fumarate reductase [Shewanella putrefaciens]MCK7630624.1 fumarate reductase cytochrome b subunit [Shewanella sp. JNE9-1]MCK7645771.1 fumarate reductase cytochrome b subunit [Shewanella sp. JNE3-1]
MSINLKIKKWSAWLDLSQSLSGVILAVFLWTHLVLVSSILFGADAMSWVARMMELSFLSSDGHGYPWVVTCIAIGIAVLAFIHVLVALQKLPMSLQQQRALRQQMQVIKHSDTRLWRWQAITGVVILLLLPVHLWLIGSAPETIGPQGSANRIWNQGVWMLYLPLLLTVELHAAIGIYRVALKWGAARDLNSRARLRKLKTIISVVFVSVGIASLLAFLPHAS